VAPFAVLWVPESQAEEYARCYGEARVQAIPDALDGNLCRKSNAILDRSPCSWTLILDDDLSAIGFYEAGRKIDLSPDEFAGMIVRHFELADALGVTLWGINQGSDALWYDTFEPFNLLAPILGPFNGHLSPKLRYDESVLGKDDYDFWLQTIRRHRKTLRANKYHYRHDHGTMPGGFVSMRTKAVEQAGVERMRQKWGKLYKPGGSAGGGRATGQNILNSKIRLPIQGC
jgi:hypothetical protein